jgi:hypothetical protein
MTNLTAQEHKEHAGEILRQLGGRQFIAMVGAKYLTFDSDLNTPNMACKISAGRKVTHMKIVLDASDTYTVTFYRIRADKINIVREVSGVYNDMLQSVFTEVTGLNTSLGTMGQ